MPDMRVEPVQPLVVGTQVVVLVVGTLAVAVVVGTLAVALAVAMPVEQVVE